MENTKIQWTDSTTNPVMGCDGCELWPSVGELRKTFASVLQSEFPKLSKEQAITIALASGGEITLTTNLYQRREEVVENALESVPSGSSRRISNATKRRLAVSLVPACYAGRLHAHRGEDPRKPDKKINRGYARVFEHPAMFPGRMAKAANYSDLQGTSRPDSPWKDGLPRLIFISDMGDCLSKDVSFDFLKREIIDVVSSEKGSLHIWQWLTKRPARMAKFAGWLAGKGVSWPQNLVAMTSVTGMKTAGRVNQLREVPAAIRGLSVEPLWEPVQLDLEGINWVIAGGASGSGAKPFDLAWARDLRDQCRAAGVACFIKQLGANPVESGSRIKLNNSHGGDWSEWPRDLRVREVPDAFKALPIQVDCKRMPQACAQGKLDNVKKASSPVCSVPGCGIPPSGNHYVWMTYCPKHYGEIIHKDLMLAYAGWDSKSEVPKRFKYLLGRISDEFDWTRGEESYLSKARVENRGYRFEKTDSGCRFMITRHPGAFTGRVKKRIVQTWEADLKARRLKLIGTRNWRANDLDL